MPTRLLGTPNRIRRQIDRVCLSCQVMRQMRDRASVALGVSPAGTAMQAGGPHVAPSQARGLDALSLRTSPDPPSAPDAIPGGSGRSLFLLVLGLAVLLVRPELLA